MNIGAVRLKTYDDTRHKEISILNSMLVNKDFQTCHLMAGNTANSQSDSHGK